MNESNQWAQPTPLRPDGTNLLPFPVNALPPIIGDMADATATSRTGLHRKMKSLLGVTPLDFIREARIRKACQMLSAGESVNDVAYACGFSNPKYFRKCFKDLTGKTPTEFKEAGGLSI